MRVRRHREGEVRLERGGRVESVHRVHAVVADPGGRILASWGDAERETLLRSAAKPFQALPLVEDGAAEAWGLGSAELALACGSHGGEPGHVEVAAGLLARLGLGEDALACGAHPPMHLPAAEALTRSAGIPTRLHNNCSGKHAGMLALALHLGWPVAGYHEERHPVQKRMAREVARWTGVPEARLGRGVDGCGVICFSTPLHALARGYARLLAAALEGSEGPRRIVEAMTGNPFLVAGTGRLCTALMQEADGALLAKVGAEGVYALAFRNAEGTPVGVALKVEDGARRAAEVAAVTLLRALAPPGPLREAGGDWARPAVPNTRGEAAAFLVPAFEAFGEVEVRDPVAGPGPALPPGLRALVRLSAAQAARDRKGVERCMGEVVLAVRRGELPGQGVEEAILQSHLFLGYPSALETLALWRRSGHADVQSTVNERPAIWDLRGPRVLDRVYGAQAAGLRKNIAALHPDMDRWMVREGYGKVLGRPGLPLRERELLISVILAVQDAPRQLHSHLRGALRAGASSDEVSAALAAAGPWMGDPEVRARARARWEAVKERWDRGDASVPNSSQAKGNDVH